MIAASPSLLAMSSAKSPMIFASSSLTMPPLRFFKTRLLRSRQQSNGMCGPRALFSASAPKCLRVETTSAIEDHSWPNRSDWVGQARMIPVACRAAAPAKSSLRAAQCDERFKCTCTPPHSGERSGLCRAAPRLKAHAWKLCIRESVTQLRITLPPPEAYRLALQTRTDSNTE